MENKMKTTTESVLIVTNENGVVVALIRKDTSLQKNLIYKITDASMTDIEDLIWTKGVEEVPG